MDPLRLHEMTVTTATEEAGSEQLGVEPWDRPTIYRDSAAAATDNRLPYWAVLILSGGIATLGLALNSSAVVIGAMLVAPLLSPIVGLALALAVGDGRLAAQTAAVVLGSTLAVLLVGAALTFLLPFQTITVEISARTRPTTLDLVIAVFSGLVGSVVTVARGSRLSAAIPGVAIAVALIPPLAVAGFGIGAGMNGEIIKGSLLLYGANLAGIVLSAMTVFLLVGMHRPNVVDTAKRWHRDQQPHGLAGWADRLRWVRSLEVFRSVWARLGLVLAFAVALGVPLSETLAQISREARVERAVGEVAGDLFEVRDRASILNRQVVYGSDRTQVYLRVATTEWFDVGTREEFERRASAGAGEQIRLTLEQLPVRGEDIDQLSSLLTRPQGTAPPSPPAGVEDIFAEARLRLEQALASLALPEGVQMVSVELGTTLSGSMIARAEYAATSALSAQAEEMLRGQLRRGLELPELDVRLSFLSTAPRPLSGTPADSLALGEIAELVRTRPETAVEITGPEGTRESQAAVAGALASRGLASERVISRASQDAPLSVRVVLPPRP